MVPGSLSPGLKKQVFEANNSPPSSAEARNAWGCRPTSPYVFMAWCLIKG